MNHKTRKYYDAFSEKYDIDRFGPYHSLVRELELDLILPHVKGKRVLDVGCGTGLVLQELRKVAAHAEGIDSSSGMLRAAKERGLKVREGSATSLPYKGGSFDVVVSLKVLPHIEDIHAALREIARVLRLGGWAFLEFYNPRSIRFLIKEYFPRMTSRKYSEKDVFTRYDSLKAIREYFNGDLSIAQVRGIRIGIIHSGLLKIPGFSKVLSAFERKACDSALRRYGGFLLIALQKHNK